jgi:hypothetical protein
VAPPVLRYRFTRGRAREGQEMSFGVFCVEDDAFTTNIFGAIVTYPNLTEAGRAAVVWREVDGRTYLVLQVLPSGRPYGWPPPG